MILCIYHANCADGFGAAWVVKKALPEAEFHPGVYQEPPPDVADRDVVLVDFSYKRQTLLAMAGKARSILILDHHKTSADDLMDLPDNITTVFDARYSGVMLAWRHYFPDTQPPPLVEHIQDRDLWRFALPGTREILACVFSYPYAFDTWDLLMARGIETLRYEGEILERKHHKDVAEIVRETKRRMVIGGFDVPVANTPHAMSSDAGHLMDQCEPFAACYHDTAKGRVFSLRSNDSGLDVSAVAKIYGGGGNKNAAGFRVSFTHPLARNEQGDV